MGKKRNSNIEILRIISMLMIVVSHYSVHNGIDNSLLSLGINRFLLESLSLGNIGVILFVMITGYFMIDSDKNFSMKRLLVLYLQVWFYSLLFYLIFLVFGYESFSFKSLITYIFPFTFRQYWFVSVYIILYIFHPYINKILHILSRDEYIKFLYLMLFFFSVLPSVIKFDFYGSEIVQFVLFYSLGAYFKKYPDTFFSQNRKRNYILFFLSVFLLLSSVFVIDLLRIKFDFNYFSSIHFFNRNSILSIIFSILLFNLFINKDEYYSKTINTISSCVFGIYLISDHEIVRKFLWIDLCKNSEYVFSKYFILHLIACNLLVFVVCWIVEFIRKNTIEKVALKILNIDNKKT